MWKHHTRWSTLVVDDDAWKAYIEDRNRAIRTDPLQWDWTEIDKQILSTLDTGFEATAILDIDANMVLSVQHLVVGDNPCEAPLVRVPGLIHLHTHPGKGAGDPSEQDLVNALDRNNKCTYAWSVVYNWNGRWIYRSSGVDFEAEPLTREHYQRRVKKLEEAICEFEQRPGFKPHTELIEVLQNQDYQVYYIPFVPNSAFMMVHYETGTPTLWCNEDMMDTVVTKCE
jgi:hypothetical protein